jgi:hypothetical protein
MAICCVEVNLKHKMWWLSTLDLDIYFFKMRFPQTS